MFNKIVLFEPKDPSIDKIVDFLLVGRFEWYI
jgi:hypothetical protein